MKTEPKTMTQEAFEALPEAQQTFYKSLVETGQCVIIPTPETPTPAPQEEKKPDKKRYYTPFSQFKDQPVEAILTCGTVVAGMLDQIWQYEVVITSPTGEKLLVMKHAIAILRHTGGSL